MWSTIQYIIAFHSIGLKSYSSVQYSSDRLQSRRNATTCRVLSNIKTFTLCICIRNLIQYYKALKVYKGRVTNPVNLQGCVSSKVSQYFYVKQWVRQWAFHVMHNINIVMTAAFKLISLLVTCGKGLFLVTKDDNPGKPRLNFSFQSLSL